MPDTIPAGFDSIKVLDAIIQAVEEDRPIQIDLGVFRLLRLDVLETKMALNNFQGAYGSVQDILARESRRV